VSREAERGTATAGTKSRASSPLVLVLFRRCPLSASALTLFQDGRGISQSAATPLRPCPHDCGTLTREFRKVLRAENKITRDFDGPISYPKLGLI